MLKKPWLPLLLVVVVLFSAAGLSRLRFETEVLEVMPRSLAPVRALQDFRKHFARDRQVIVLLQSAGGNLEKEDAAELADYLREKWPGVEVGYKSAFEDDPELFAGSVARVWSYTPPGDIDVLMARLQNEENLAEHLGRVKGGLKNSFDQERASISSYDPLGFLQHPGLQNLLDSDMDFQSDDGTSRILFISRASGGAVSYKQDGVWTEDIRAAVSAWLQENEYDDLTFRLSGGPVYNAEIGSGMEKDMSGTVTITSLLVALLFFIMQRRLCQLVVIAFLVALTFLITLGLGGWIFGTLNLVSVGFAAILLGLIIDYAVVIIRESPHAEGSAASIRKMVGPSILWAALTTAIVFGVLMMSTFTGVRQLGGLITIGLLVGALVMLIFTPMLLEKRPAEQASRMAKPWFPSVGWVVLILIIALSGSGLIFALKGSPQLNMDLKTMEPESSEAVATYAIMQQKYSAWSGKNAVLISSSKSLPELCKQSAEMRASLSHLQNNKTIDTFQWPYELIPNRNNYADNAAKLKRLAGMREGIISEAGDAGFTEHGLALDRLILEAFEKLPANADGLGAACAADPLIGLFFAIDDQGTAFFSGKMKLTDEITPETLEIFDGFEKNGVSVTGWTILESILLPHVKRDFYVIFLPSAGLLLLTLFLVFRSWQETLISIVVLLTSLLLVNALVVLTGRTWNFLSSLAIPLIVGAGIDYSIHLIFTLRRQNGDLAAVWNSVGKAIFFCGLSSTVGFGSLLFASNEVLRSMGLLCSLGILTTMSLSLLVIPCLWKCCFRERSVQR